MKHQAPPNLGPLFAPPRDPNVASTDVARLSGQNLAIYRRLQQGPATNKELAGMALKYTSRLSDLRAAGFTIAAKRVGDEGCVVYSLVKEVA